MNRITSAWRSLRRNHGHALAVGGGVILAALFGLFLWGILDWYIDPDNAKEPSTAKKDLMQAWGFIMAGAAGGVGIYFTWSNLQNARENLQLTQKSTEENLRLTREGQITERFAQAIEQLGATDDKGNKRLEIRLGGIYALERIANDSPKRDYSTIIEVLTTYVRENAPWHPEESPPPSVKPDEDGKAPILTVLGRYVRVVKTWRQPEESSPPSVESDEDDKAPTETEKQEPSKPPADIQAILTVLGRRKKAGEEDDVVLDLSATDLRGANLVGANLQKANLSKANLQEAMIREAYLQEAILEEANLQEAILEEAKLKDAILGHANLQEAILGHANLRRANLRKADVRGANLRKANLWEVDLRDANLQEADLQETDLRGTLLWAANLQEADLQRANLQGNRIWQVDLQEAYLWRANLREADLTDANLQGADLGGADLWRAHFPWGNLQRANLRAAKLQEAFLQGANLREANLQKTNLQGTWLTQDQINSAYGDETTQLPDHLQRPAHWSKGEE